MEMLNRSPLSIARRRFMRNTLGTVAALSTGAISPLAWAGAGAPEPTASRVKEEDGMATTGVKHRFIDTNNITMHIAEQGDGPLVILCHGFPEIWYSWRHQLPALAEAGYHAVAPDQRGYGQTDRPEPIAAYNIFQLTGDIVGLVHGLGESQAVFVGHDWGSPVVSHLTLRAPERVRGTV